MLFIPTFYYLWSRDALSRMRFRHSFNNKAEKDTTASTDRYHADAVNDLQKLKRSYHLERRTFL
ncbi:MAG: hypothetical protein AAGF01_04455 [Cyanobacteria bacterium P01_G01_bin.38]